MAHLVDTMAYVGQVPWHGLGEQLEAGQSLDQWRIAAGMDWRVKSTAVRFPTSTGPAKFEGRNVLFRSDTEAPLSVVSDKYKVVQPAEILEFFRDVTDAGHMEIDTAGVLDGGKKLWALACTKYDIDIGGDKMNNYCLLVTACDGSMATRCYYTNIRVVCNNTLQWSLQEAGRGAGVSIPHSTEFDMRKVQKLMGIDVIEQSVQAFSDQVVSLANLRLNNQEQTEFFTALVTKTEFGGTRDDATPHQLRLVDTMEQLALNSPGARLDTAAGTAWGMVNAVTHFVDFHQNAASNNNRFKSAQFGEGAQLKNRARALGLMLAA